MILMLPPLPYSHSTVYLYDFRISAAKSLMRCGCSSLEYVTASWILKKFNGYVNDFEKYVEKKSFVTSKNCFQNHFFIRILQNYAHIVPFYDVSHTIKWLTRCEQKCKPFEQLNHTDARTGPQFFLFLPTCADSCSCVLNRNAWVLVKSVCIRNCRYIHLYYSECGDQSFLWI